MTSIVVGSLCGLGALAGERREPVGSDGGELAVVEVHDLPGVADERGDVAGDVHLPVADADDQRRAVAGDDDPVGVVRMQDGQAVGAVDLVERRRGRRPRASAAVDRAIRWAITSVSVSEASSTPSALSCSRSVAALSMMPLCTTRDPLGLVEVRVRVGVGGRAVGGPPGVADADLAGEALRQRRLEVADPTGPLGHPERLRAEDGDAGRVVAAVLELGQALDDQRDGGLPADVPHDSAHVDSPQP